MVGRVGYAPTTPAMSMQYSTIELTALKLIYIFYSIFIEISRWNKKSFKSIGKINKKNFIEYFEKLYLKETKG